MKIGVLRLDWHLVTTGNTSIFEGLTSLPFHFKDSMFTLSKSHEVMVSSIQNFLDREVDPVEIERVQPVEIERVQNDMLVHYLRPTDNWNFSRKYVWQAMECDEIVTDMLREIWELKKK